MQKEKKKREREKGPEKIFEEVIAENFPNMGKGNGQLNLGNPESPRQDKPKEEDAETQSNQVDNS